jgi:hypothetical protein
MRLVFENVRFADYAKHQALAGNAPAHAMG